MPEFLDLHGKTSKALRGVVEAAMRRHGLYAGQDLVLALLWERDGRTPGELATALHVTTPTVVKAANRMTASGLLTRRRDERDNRLVGLWLTDAGRALQGPIEAERRLIEEKVTADLGDAEREQLISALTRVQRSAADLLRPPADGTSDADDTGEAGETGHTGLE